VGAAAQVVEEAADTPGVAVEVCVIALFGILVVIASVIGGYMMEGGHLLVLFQPAELVIIGGAALGALLIGTAPTTSPGPWPTPTTWSR
jgi:hypothetical protein